jgi:carboxylate-amine ligase
VIEAAFGARAPLTLGVEEELMIVDSDTLDQVPAVDRIIAGVAGRDLPGVVKTELFASVFELNTHPCETAAEADAALVELRRAAAEAAEAEGLAVAAAGSHPFARPEAQPVVKEERYVSFVGYAGISARRQGVQGLHVHVGMPSGDDCSKECCRGSPRCLRSRSTRRGSPGS